MQWFEELQFGHPWYGTMMGKLRLADMVCAALLAE